LQESILATRVPDNLSRAAYIAPVIISAASESRSL